MTSLAARIGLLLGILCAGVTTLEAQETRPTSRPTSRPGWTQIRLLNGTTWFQAPEQSRTPTYLSGAQVSVSIGSEEVAANADASGTVEIDLRQASKDSVIQLKARVGQTVYIAAHWQNSQPPADTIPMYEVTRDGSDLELSLYRAVTELVDATSTSVYVEQTVVASDRNYRVFVPEGLGEGVASVVFPVPRGVEVSHFRIDGESATEQDLVEVPGWGLGFPKSIPLFPQRRWSGSYRLTWPKGKDVDLGVEGSLYPRRVTLALQEDRFEYQHSGERTALQDMGVRQPEQMDERCRFWYGEFAMGTPGSVPVRYAERKSATPGLEKMRLVLRTRLFDGTLWFAEQDKAQHDPNSGHGGDIVAQTRITNAQVFAHVVGLDGEPEVVEFVTSELGAVEADLGDRYQASEVTLKTTRNGVPYESAPIPVASVPNLVLLYKVGNDPSVLRQSVMRIVSEVPDAGDTPPCKVRQIVQVTIDAYEIYPARDGNFFYPVPEGAIVDELSVNQVAVASLEPRHDPVWGYGVPVSIAVEAQGRGVQMMGTFRVALKEGEHVDLGLSQRPGSVERFTLALEKPRFQYLAEEEGAAPLQQGADETIQLGGMGSGGQGGSRVCTTFFGAVPAGGELKAPVRFGAPPVKARTWLLTLVIFGVIGGGIGLGLLVSSMRGGSKGTSYVSQLAELDGRLARGELTPEAYAAEQRRLQSELGSATSGATAAASILPDDLRARLDELSKERSRAPEEVAEDYAALSEAVRELLGNAEASTAGAASAANATNAATSGNPANSSNPTESPPLPPGHLDLIE